MSFLIYAVCNVRRTRNARRADVGGEGTRLAEELDELPARLDDGRLWIVQLQPLRQQQDLVDQLKTSERTPRVSRCMFSWHGACCTLHAARRERTALTCERIISCACVASANSDSAAPKTGQQWPPGAVAGAEAACVGITQQGEGLLTVCAL